MEKINIGVIRKLLALNKVLPVVFMVENTTDKIKTAILFGADRFLSKMNYGSDEGIIIKSDNGDVEYNEVIQSNDLANNHYCENLLITSKNKSQTLNTLTIINSKFNGIKMTMPCTPREIEFDDDTIVEYSSFIRSRIVFSKESWIEVKVEPKTKVEFSFYPSEIKKKENN